MDDEGTTILRQLDALIENIHELEEIGDHASRFNLFEAIGLHKQELRHSTFLSFIMDPTQSHGFGGAFLKRFLIKTALADEGRMSGLTAADIACADWDEAMVFRERYSIDILIQNEEEKILVAIENKVHSSEHSNQLQRYHTLCRDTFADYRCMFVYLTPEGQEPSHQEYLSASYQHICDTLEQVCHAYHDRVSNEIRMSCEHYIDLVRRKIMGHDPLKEKATKLYKRYKSAFDYIIENVPSSEDDVCALMREFVSVTPELKHISGTKLMHCFPVAWEIIPPLNEGSSWRPSTMLMNVEVDYRGKSVDVDVYLGAGPEEARQLIYGSLQSSKVLKNVSGKLYPGYTKLYEKTILPASVIQSGDVDEMRQIFETNWTTFQKGDLQLIIQEISALFTSSGKTV